MHTVYIVPAFTDVAAQCRIYIRDGRIPNARDNYRVEPDAWRELGLMDSRGAVRCIEPGPWADELRQSQPLMAGSQWFY